MILSPSGACAASDGSAPGEDFAMRTILLATATALVVASAAAAAAAAGAPPIESREARSAQAVGGLVIPPPKAGRSKPLVAVIGQNAGAETTDFIIPYGVLKDADVAEVRAVSSGPGPVRLMKTLKVQADLTIEEFDLSAPEGADIVIVPAQAKPKDPVLAAWLTEQARKGAVVVSICEGARVLAHAGLLENRRATTHWFAIKDLERAYPKTAWVRNQRYVQDGPVISTTGVSASLPASIALVEAIGGREAAAAVASRLGVTTWGPVHRTADFRLSRGELAYALFSIVAFWTHETIEAPITDGEDEIALALRTDTWSRGFRARVITTHPDGAPVRSRRGLVIVPDDPPKGGRYVLSRTAGPAARELDAAISGLAHRYGCDAARLAQLGMEYMPPQQAAPERPIGEPQG